MAYEYPNLTPVIKDALDRYWHEKIRPGGFLQAVLANDLMEAWNRADMQNREPEVMQDLLWYVWNEMPANCHGTCLALDYWAGPVRE